MIDIKLAKKGHNLIVVTFSRVVTQEDVDKDYRFGQIIKGFGGRPFRVLNDFTTTETMPEKVADAYLRAQAFALKKGLERDAFVTRSATLRLQFNRIASTTKRLDVLGPLRFFDTVAEAEAYLLG